MKLKILDALRTNSTAKLESIISQIDNDKANFQMSKLKDELLIYAVQVGPLSAIKYILEHQLVVDLNVQDSNGNTCLHLAAMSNRSDVIVYLMAQPFINDCILNNEHKQPFQCTNDIQIAQLMDKLRTKYISAITSQLRKGFDTLDYSLLDTILTNPRNKELLDINGTDPYTGDTILLEYIKKNNIQMVEFILNHGADPFKRSSTGKSPEECTISPEMKEIITESFTRQNVMDSTSKPQEGCPTFRGFLMKWTNFAGGYKLRWFVLDKEARLSYYKSPNDMNNTCRGLIHLAHAMIRVDSSENSKFEIIIQNPSDGTPVRWHLKSEHATETQKWVWVLQNAITFAKDHEKKSKKHLSSQHSSKEETTVTHSGLPNVPMTIPESRQLTNEELEESHEVKPVSQVISEAENAAKEFKDLLIENESEVDLPLKLSRGSIEIPSDEMSDDTNNNLLNSPKSNGPVPNRTLGYAAAPPKIRTSMDSQRSNRTSNSTTGSTASDASTSNSKGSKAKKIYKKQLNKITNFGRKKKSVKMDNFDEFNSSQMSFADSNASSIEYDNEYSEDGESAVLDPSSTDLNIIRNQMHIQLITFKDFLKQSGKDDSISNHQLSDTCTGILNTLESLINKEGEIVNKKYNELAHRLEKQHKISTIWENSIKQLEFEIRDRESKIVELEDKLKNVKKSLRNSVLVGSNGHLSLNSKTIPFIDIEPEQKSANPNSAAALARLRLSQKIPEKPTSAPPVPVQLPSITTTDDDNVSSKVFTPSEVRQPSTPAAPSDQPPAPPSMPPPAVPLDPTLAKFLEEQDDSDDEFFDAENNEDEVRDMSILEKIETERCHREEEKSAAAPVSVPPPDFEPPKVPVKSVYESKMAIEDESEEEQEQKEEQPSEEKTSDESETERLAIKKTTTVGSQWFQPDRHSNGHYVVNDHELLSKSQEDRFEKLMTEHTFKGYNDPFRTTLAPEDNRPKISLWGVLKSLVGKDMTKMTLPVSFNEPTSLLQRNVEVVEYSDLLDKASTIESSTLRLVYVAAFAASEYASTVGRIAKPFNPLLGETFEYARPDKGYRCFVEQVSHHPPISALVAESSSWSYYGESNVKTKFLGRSFDIKHLGTWFCELYPDQGVKAKNGETKDMELYSWRKVNNSVIGIIVGNPTIDNYGDMEITNHTTGDSMKYTFKPRGWRASSAYEVKGEVFNNKGELQYTIGGHWNDKIYCKPAYDKNAEKFLVWQAAPRTEMMFHLTNFAATLNAPQKSLLPVIACTDTRLRPDQRAMENGEYDLASEEKNRVEEKQRDARKQREIKGEDYKPSFFDKSHHPVTGEEFWSYRGNYWSERDAGKLKNYKDIF